MSITWNRNVLKPVRLLVDNTPERPIGKDSPLEEANLADLRAACVAVGLVVMDRGVYDEIVAKGERNRESADYYAKALTEAEGEKVAAQGALITEKARAEKAEARVTELETALRNAAHGIATGDAAPVVHTLRARHDEKEAEWEKEREELVRTRQETQDKLSEARKELGELGAKLRTSERYVDVHVADLAAMRARLSDTFARAEKAERLLAEEKGAFLLVADAVGLVHEQSMGPRFAGPAEDVVAEVRGFVAENARLTAELKAIKAPVAGEPTESSLQSEWLKYGLPAANFALKQWRAGHAAGLAKVKNAAKAFMMRPVSELEQPSVEKLSEVVMNNEPATQALFNFGVEQGLNHLFKAIEEVSGEDAPTAKRVEKVPASPAPDAPAGSGVEVVPVTNGGAK